METFHAPTAREMEKAPNGWSLINIKLIKSYEFRLKSGII